MDDAKLMYLSCEYESRRILGGTYCEAWMVTDGKAVQARIQLNTIDVVL